jgi:hypothetical protein
MVYDKIRYLRFIIYITLVAYAWLIIYSGTLAFENKAV